jgi:hypothetical protein
MIPIFLLSLCIIYIVITSASSNSFYQPRGSLQRPSSSSGNNTPTSKVILNPSRLRSYFESQSPPIHSKKKSGDDQKNRIMVFTMPQNLISSNPTSIGDNKEKSDLQNSPTKSNTYKTGEQISDYPTKVVSSPLLEKIKRMDKNIFIFDERFLSEGSIGLQEEPKNLVSKWSSRPQDTSGKNKKSGIGSENDLTIKADKTEEKLASESPFIETKQQELEKTTKEEANAERLVLSDENPMTDEIIHDENIFRASEMANVKIPSGNSAQFIISDEDKKEKDVIPRYHHLCSPFPPPPLPIPSNGASVVYKMDDNIIIEPVATKESETTEKGEKTGLPHTEIPQSTLNMQKNCQLENLSKDENHFAMVNAEHEKSGTSQIKNQETSEEKILSIPNRNICFSQPSEGNIGQGAEGPSYPPPICNDQYLSEIPEPISSAACNDNYLDIIEGEPVGNNETNISDTTENGEKDEPLLQVDKKLKNEANSKNIQSLSVSSSMERELNKNLPKRNKVDQTKGKLRKVRLLIIRNKYGDKLHILPVPRNDKSEIVLYSFLHEKKPKLKKMKFANQKNNDYVVNVDKKETRRRRKKIKAVRPRDPRNHRR